MTKMDLNTSLAEAQLAVDFFFNNKFGEARQLMEPWSVCLCLYGIFNASVLYSVDRFMLCNSKKKNSSTFHIIHRFAFV